LFTEALVNTSGQCLETISHACSYCLAIVLVRRILFCS
jgi:hypothetical protein